MTSAGAGALRWQGIDLTRWSPDTTMENTGTWLYVQEELPGHKMSPVWSATFQPAGVWPESEHVDFHPHMVDYSRTDHGIALSMRVTVAPNDDVEIRRVLLTNHTDASRRLRLASYGEVVLAPHADDVRHPAFSKLFIESEYVAQENALIFHRRPRDKEGVEKPLYLAHCVLTGTGLPTAGGAVSAKSNLPPNGSGSGYHESDRAHFFGRRVHPTRLLR